MYKDNEFKYAAILNPKIPLWMAMNVLAHMANALSRQMRQREDLAFVNYVDGSGVFHGSFPVHPYIILQAKTVGSLSQLASDLKAAGDSGSGLQSVHIIEPMIGHSNEEQLRRTAETSVDAVPFLGVACYGPSSVIDPMLSKHSAVNVNLDLKTIGRLSREMAASAAPVAAGSEAGGGTAGEDGTK